jgi:hypothetical protein
MTTRAAVVSRREWVWVVLWALLVMGLTCLPYWHAREIAGERTFAGTLWGVDEGNVYLAWLRQAAEGRTLLHNQYCVAPENPRFFNLYLQLGGKLSALTGLAPVAVWQGLRVAAGVFLLLSLYLLVAEVTRDRVARWATLALASLGSGLGWVVVVQGGWLGLKPIDVGTGWQVQPEAVTFLSLLLSGLFVASMGLMCQGFVWALRAVRDDSRRAAVGAGLCLLVLGNIHTYNVFPVHLALVVWLAVEIVRGRLSLGRAGRHYGLILAVSIPSVLWALYAATADPAFMAKGLTPTPAFRLVDYVVGYGLIGLLAVVGAVGVVRAGVIQAKGEGLAGKPLPGTLMVAWAVAGSLVLLIPVSFQRKMIEGLHLPLCLLAGLAVAALARGLTGGLRARGKHKQAAERVVLTVMAVAVFALPSNALFVADCLSRLKTNNAELLGVLQPPLYLQPGEVKALEWLRHNATAEDIVLSSSMLGSHIPAWCPARVWVGHWAETLALEGPGGYLSPRDPVSRWQEVAGQRNPGGTLALRRFGEQLAVARRVYGAGSEGAINDPESLRQWLESLPVTLVVYGPWEEALTAAVADDPQAGAARWRAMAGLGLSLVHETQGVAVYRVAPDVGEGRP